MCVLPAGDSARLFSGHRSEHFLPSILTFCPLGILTVSLSPRSVSSCMRNPVVPPPDRPSVSVLGITPHLYLYQHDIFPSTTKRKRKYETEGVGHARYKSPSFRPCTMFWRRMAATCSACWIAPAVCGSVGARDALARNPSRIDARAALRTLSSPVFLGGKLSGSYLRGGGGGGGW